MTNIEEKTLRNNYFREVLFTAPRIQLVVMSLTHPGEEIGLETHMNVDQFIRIESGKGKAILDGDEQALEDRSAVVIPAGTRHNIINSSRQEPLKLYTIYSPPKHPDGTVHKNKALFMKKSIITSRIEGDLWNRNRSTKAQTLNSHSSRPTRSSELLITLVTPKLRCTI